MKKRTMTLLSIAAAWLPPFAMQAVDYVHLSEILYDTPLNEQIVSPPYSNGEYVELYNAGDSVDLSGWLLCGDGSTEQYEFGAVVMPPQSFLIVAYRHVRSPEFLLFWLFNVSERMRNKWFRQNGIFHIRKEFYTDAYRAYIREHDQFPYELILYFRCRFITYCQGLPLGVPCMEIIR